MLGKLTKSQETKLLQFKFPMLVTYTMDVEDMGTRAPREISDFSIASIIGRSGRAAAEVLKLKAKNKLLSNTIRPLGMSLTRLID